MKLQNSALGVTNTRKQGPSWGARVHCLAKKFPWFFGTREFVTVFTTARPFSLSWVRLIQFTASNLVSLRSILLFSHLRSVFPSGLFLSGFLMNNAVCVCHPFHACSPSRQSLPLCTCVNHVPLHYAALSILLSLLWLRSRVLSTCFSYLKYVVFWAV